ncbi:MAG: DUF72 domain-containing protein [Candidatus Omnitrophica bacterium]|nr:DUF72 domain-containing protein [Candidatus Omnitrophota bacterium]
MIKVGCCGFPVSWQEYIKEFKLVEVQKTFYNPPGDNLLIRWREKAPSDFEFTVKAWQLITHPSSSPTYRRLKKALDFNRAGFFNNTSVVKYGYKRTVECARILNAGIILFQTPPSFTSSKKNINHLKYFFTHIATEKFIYIWEPRGKWDWSEVEKLARELRIFIAVDPFKVKPFSQEILYLRLHGIDNYRYRYSHRELEQLINTIRGLRYDVCYVLFNNIYMWESALKFKELL